MDSFESQFVRPKAGRTLIVGSRIYRDKEDRRKRYADAVGVDMLAGPGVDVVLDLEDPPPARLGDFAHIECLSVLEHSRRPWLLAANLEFLLVPGGTIFVAVPFVWRMHAYPDDYWRFTPSGVRALFELVEWEAFSFGYGSTIAPVEDKVPSLKRNGLPYFARTETFAFGRVASC